MHYTLRSGVSTEHTTFKCEVCGVRYDEGVLLNYGKQGLKAVTQLREGHTCLPTTTEEWMVIRMVCSDACLAKTWPMGYYSTYQPWLLAQVD